MVEKNPNAMDNVFRKLVIKPQTIHSTYKVK